MTGPAVSLAPMAVPGGSAGPERVGGSGRSSTRRGEGVATLVFLGPWLIGLAAFTILPMLASLYLAMTDFSLLDSAEWIGLGNLDRAVDDPVFWQAVRNTLLYVVLTVPLKLVVSLAVAMLLNIKLRGRSFYRSALFVPSLLGTSIAVAITWKEVFSAGGPINQVLALFGIEGPDWVSDPRYALFTVVLLSVWQFGTPMLIFLAGLQQIPHSLLEAAEVDGASRWRVFISIVLPLLTPVVLFNLVMQVIGSFQVFSQAYVINGPVNSTLLFVPYLYEQGFVNFSMGYSSFMAWLLVVAIAALTAFNFWLSKRWVHYDDAA